LACALLAAMVAAPWAPALALAAGGDEDLRDVSVAEYRGHLEELDRLAATCQKQRTSQACDPAQAGPDDRVELATGGASLQREVRYDWLRDLLDRAGKSEKPVAGNAGQAPAANDQPLGVDALLAQARQRLAEDWKQAGAPVEASPGYDSERKTLNAILARKEYQGVSRSSARDRFIEWLENRLDEMLAGLVRFGSRSPWIAFALRVLLLVGLCLGLVWALVRIERRSRIRLVPELIAVPGAPSAREWQLWLQDAHAMAAQGLWREAIHFLYWAAIARLESRRLWPADRARTPREYLRLLPAADPRMGNLATLTRSFERTWYGGRQAGSSDYKAALKLAAELGVE
jgi:Domain of unknown function (DUF4129)